MLETMVNDLMDLLVRWRKYADQWREMAACSPLAHPAAGRSSGSVAAFEKAIEELETVLAVHCEELADTENTLSDPTREALADYAHGAWSGWMRYLFSQCQLHTDGSFTIPPDLAERWDRQTKTPYANLTKEEQDSDRKEADRMLEIVRPR